MNLEEALKQEKPFLAWTWDKDKKKFSQKLEIFTYAQFIGLAGGPKA